MSVALITAAVTMEVGDTTAGTAAEMGATAVAETAAARGT
jgi:hypothetical protein